MGRRAATEMQARVLVRTVGKYAKKGGNQPGMGQAIKASEKAIKRAGKIWTNNGQPLKGRGSKPTVEGLANKKTGRSFRFPSKKPYSKKKVANFQQRNPRANVHVEVR